MCPICYENSKEGGMMFYTEQKKGKKETKKLLMAKIVDYPSMHFPLFSLLSSWNRDEMAGTEVAFIDQQETETWVPGNTMYLLEPPHKFYPHIYFLQKRKMTHILFELLSVLSLHRWIWS